MVLDVQLRQMVAYNILNRKFQRITAGNKSQAKEEAF
jgi:hypothetical protein